jgi:hypothetical protein
VADQLEMPQVQVTNPLQWAVGHGTSPNGSPFCVLQLQQGQLALTAQFAPHDMDAMGKALVDAASQARSGLIIPVGAIGANGQQKT